jgi:hypothetical protein
MKLSVLTLVLSLESVFAYEVDPVSVHFQLPVLVKVLKA